VKEKSQVEKFQEAAKEAGTRRVRGTLQRDAERLD